jgi:RNA polymerase sigma-70 factor, ECF subfamily
MKITQREKEINSMNTYGDSSQVQGWDAHLVDLAKRGDVTAFELLMDTHRPRLTGMALRKLHNADDAADVVQETFVKVYRSLKDFDASRPIRPWMSRICMNCIVDMARQRKNSAEPIDKFEYSLSDEGESSERADSSIIRGQIMEAIKRLPWRYRQIIMLRHFEHMDVSEIAAKLQKPEGTIKSWLFRARALLQVDLTPALG